MSTFCFHEDTQVAYNKLETLLTSVKQVMNKQAEELYSFINNEDNTLTYESTKNLLNTITKIQTMQ